MLNQALYVNKVEQIVHEEITNIMSESGGDMGELNNDIKLNAELGMSSLELARLVSVLDERLEADPFFEMVSITSVRTIGDLVNAYNKAVVSNVGR